jgi:hypothetical protein
VHKYGYILFENELDLEYKSVYTCLLQKILNLESGSIRTMCFIIFMRNMITLYQLI